MIFAKQDRSLEASCWSGVASEETMPLEEGDCFQSPVSMGESSGTKVNREYMIRRRTPTAPGSRRSCCRDLIQASVSYSSCRLHGASARQQCAHASRRHWRRENCECQHRTPSASPIEGRFKPTIRSNPMENPAARKIFIGLVFRNKACMATTDGFIRKYNVIAYELMNN